MRIVPFDTLARHAPGRLVANDTARHHARMNIVTWNVNSLNVRLPHVLRYL